MDKFTSDELIQFKELLFKAIRLRHFDNDCWDACSDLERVVVLVDKLARRPDLHRVCKFNVLFGVEV